MELSFLHDGTTSRTPSMIALSAVISLIVCLIKNYISVDSVNIRIFCKKLYR